MRPLVAALALLRACIASALPEARRQIGPGEGWTPAAPAVELVPPGFGTLPSELLCQPCPLLSV
jgi:hypothetical protein